MRRAVLVLLSAGVVGLAVPTGPARADGGLGGFVANATATPLRIEIYEPTIPIPNEPQAELNLAFTQTKASSGPSASGRASYLWPGAPVGEGFKTIVEQFGLPAELGKAGYPVQVNAQYPGDTSSQRQEPFPGATSRTTVDAKTAVARSGFQLSGEPEDGDAKPEQSGVPGLDALNGLGGLLGGGTGDGAGGATPSAPGLGALTAVVDAGGATSVSKSTYEGGEIVASGVTRITDLRLLAGLVTADSVKVLSRTTSTQGKSDSDADVEVSGLAIAGVPFGITKDGVVAAGQTTPISGLPNDPGEALKMLGITFKLPTATKSGQGGDGKQSVRGLQIQIDFAALRDQFDSKPIDDLIASLPFPPEAAQLKSLLGAITQAKPRIVLVLGDVTTETSAVDPISLPGTGPVTSGAGGGAASGGAVGDTGGDAPALDAPAVDAGDPVTSELPVQTAPVKNAGAGLPPLGSIPGMLVIGGIALASALGWYFQKIGGLVLGGGAACAHGLESGIPDLRKA